MDSHADTCVLGCNFVKVGNTGKKCSVSPFISTYEDFKEIEIVSGATMVQHPSTGESLILIIHQALWFGDNNSMEHTLLNPNQIRSFGHEVQDNPFADSPMGITVKDIFLPFTSQGTTIYFESCKPTEQELQTCRKLHLTSSHEWKPNEVQFPHVNISSVHTQTGPEITCAATATLRGISPTLDNDEY